MRLARTMATLGAIVLLAMVALAQPTQADMPDLSLIDLSMQMPVDLADSPEGMTPQAVAALHETAGSFADEAILEAQHASMLMETDSIAARPGGASKWDDSVPEVHLKTGRPEEILSTELETVDHLEHVRPSLTVGELASPVMMAQQLAMVGQDHAMIQQQSQASVVQTVAAHAVGQSNADSEVHAVVVAESSVEAALDADAATVSEAEAKAGVLTMSELKQMMELEGMSRAEIDQYMENLAEVTLTAETDAEAETETQGEQETEQETEQEADQSSDQETDQSAEQEMEQEFEQEFEAEAEEPEMLEVQAEPAAEEESAAPEAEALVEETSEGTPVAEEAASADEEAAPALVESASEGATETETETEAETEVAVAADADVSAEADAAIGADAAADAESEWEYTYEDGTPAPKAAVDEMIRLSAHPAPEHLVESVPSAVTPIHSRAFAKRHPALRRMASAPAGAQGYSLPQAAQVAQQRRSESRDASLVELESRTGLRQRGQSREVDLEKFNPSAIQLGPSKDLYGYQPMTGEEFLHAAGAPLSLAQINMEQQHQQRTWLPPPIEAQAVPNYVVGMGGLQPNRNAGPYQGQYGLAAGGQPIAQQPAFLQY